MRLEEPLPPEEVTAVAAVPAAATPAGVDGLLVAENVPVPIGGLSIDAENGLLSELLLVPTPAAAAAAAALVKVVPGAASGESSEPECVLPPLLGMWVECSLPAPCECAALDAKPCDDS